MVSDHEQRKLDADFGEREARRLARAGLCVCCNGGGYVLVGIGNQPLQKVDCAACGGTGKRAARNG